MSQLSDSDHTSAIGWFRKHFGISLSSDKKYLVETRLEPIAYKYGFASVKELIDELTSANESDPNLVKAVCSAITTHETSFFRDLHPFRFLANEYFPRWIEHHGDDEVFSVWSAACSTGQEIYSLMMLLKENFPDFSERPMLVEGTDISTHTLEKAKLGEFNQSEVNRGLQAQYLIKYFSQLPNGNWRICEKIRNKIQFEYHNLIGSWEKRKSYDLILLRNVLIYFDVDLKKNVLNRLKNHMNPNGVLLLGGSETTANLDPDWEVFKSENTVYYRLKS